MGLGIYGGHQREVGKGSKMQKRTGNQGMNRRNYIKCVYIYYIHMFVSIFIWGRDLSGQGRKRPFGRRIHLFSNQFTREFGNFEIK